MDGLSGIVALGEACAIAKRELTKNTESIGALRDYLETELLKIEGTSVNGNTSLGLFNTSNSQQLGEPQTLHDDLFFKFLRYVK